MRIIHKSSNILDYTLQFLCCSIIIAIIVILSKYISKKNNKEHLINWYRPFYHGKSVENPLTNINNVYNRNILNNEYSFNKLIFGSYFEDKKNKNSLMQFITYLIKIILQNSNILNIHINELQYCYDLLYKLNSNKINIGYVSSPILYDSLIAEKYFKKRLSNIRFIGNINTFSLFFFVSKTGNIKSLYELEGATISVIGKKSTSKKCVENILTHLNMKEKIDYKFSYNSFDKAMELLNENKIDCFVYDSIYPSNDLTYYFEHNINGNIQILPLDEIDENIFTSEYIYYSPIYLDLNNLSKNYLPAVLGKYNFNKFKPMLKTYSYHNYLCCNKDVDNKITYQLIKSIYNNIPNINKLKMFKNHPIEYNSVPWTSLPISIHNGVKYFFYEKGYISYGEIKGDKVEEDPNCIFLIGKKECNKKNLKQLNVPPVDFTFL